MTPPLPLHPRERAALRAARRPAQRRAWRQAAVIAAPIVIVVSAAAGVSGAVVLPAGSPPSPPPPQTTPTIPAASPERATDDRMIAIASPASGTTGTAELPPEPVALPAPAVFDMPVAAQPFSTVAATRTDRGRALECLTAAIYYEAASEPDDGQRAVAQVVLNRVRHPAFPSTVCGVVYQGSERTSGCQFSFACDGAMARVPSRSGWARATRIAAAALAGQVFAPVGLATHYHTYAVTPSWNRTLVMTDAIGAHFFHRWKGYWGTASAFTQRYRGDEPVPGPHPRNVVPVAPTTIAPVAPITVAGAVAAPRMTAADIVQPAHRDSGELRATPLSATPLTAALPESQILDRWKDSGKPLR